MCENLACAINASVKPILDLDTYPFVAIWEVTRACELACQHCRAEAIKRRDPRELNHADSLRLLDQVARAKPTVFVLTGGDPMMRPDILEIVAACTERKIPVSMSPSATPHFANSDLRKFRDVGLKRISLSLDGAIRETHDRFRGVAGTWDRTMEAIYHAKETGLEVQINTTFSKQNLREFEAFTALMDEINPTLWSVFLLVPTGRAKPEDMFTGEVTERLFERLYLHSRKAAYPIKTTEGQHYRRVALQMWGRDRKGPRPRIVPISDGKGFVFVSHTGDIQPSGFLPITAGNIRHDELLDIYQNSHLFRDLRDSEKLGGKCGRCEFRKICGGSRARAHATTGNHLAEEPLCTYQPAPLSKLGKILTPVVV